MAGGARPLDTGERRVLDLLLAGDFDGAPALREQARGACVVGHCGCGCPSVYLAPNPDASPAAGPRRVFHRGRPPLCTGIDRDSRALPQLVAAACQVGDLGGVARWPDGFVISRPRLLSAA